MSAGWVIRHGREVAGLSRREIAGRAGVSVSFLGRLERDERPSDLGVLEALADAFVERSRANAA
ncbi:hypothetical protein GCM10009798_43340 [Nocardioides panacihumi]|uniref:HTH cro/C1-type domain-containing protein n=1 Tax=Nocardioides panacihumi TaxID=400774 RepID=A0ABP5DBR6_9ACTN